MNEKNDTLPSGLILLSQAEQLGVSQKEMLEALPTAYRALPRHDVDFEMAEIARQAIQSRDWSAAQRVLEERFQARFVPLRDKHPDYRVIYFGSAPIPLTVLLGFLLETWQQVEIVPHHHTRRVWGWVSEPDQPPARLKPLHLPEERDRTEGEAVIRVSTSHRVDPLMTRRVIPEPLVEIDIELERPAEDAFTHLEEMQGVAQAFRQALDAIGDRFPGIQRVHMFASVQPGVALLLGAQISKTMHPAVQTYQYARHTEGEPYHVPAVLVNGPSQPETVPLTEDEVARAGRDREHLKQDVERMQAFASDEHKQGAPHWLAALLPKQEKHPNFSSHWLHMPALHKTPLFQAQVDVSTCSVEDSFFLNPTLSAWQLDDHWLARLARRLQNDSQRQRALRLLVLHELAHRGPQGLTSTLSQGIGRFPRVVEEMDYHADVWAMLHEYALTNAQARIPPAHAQRFFMELVEAATETMWAFDDASPPPREFQIRRLNRYLIWYWQYLLLERGAGQGGETTLEFILSLLAQRPILELAGPPVQTRIERVFFSLDSSRKNVLELAVYHQGRLYRHGERTDFSIQALLDGVRTRDRAKILIALRGAFEQTVR